MSAHGWNVAGAAKSANEQKKPVRLVRPDGSASGLIVTPAGDLRREILKPQGKAARKQFKALRRQIRELGAGASESVVRVLKRKALSLCQPAQGAGPAARKIAEGGATNSDPFSDKKLKAEYTESFLKGNEDARAGREYSNPHQDGPAVLKDAYWAGWNSGGGKDPAKAEGVS